MEKKAHIDKLAADAVELLKEMIAIPSPSFREDEVCSHISVWMDRKGFEDLRVGDSVSFFAEVYRYVKTSNGKQIDYSLRNPESIKKIPSYELPTDKELKMQSINAIICESCYLYDNCNGSHCLRPAHEIRALQKQMMELLK